MLSLFPARHHSTAKGTHYEVLEVVNSATLEQIKASYYRLSKVQLVVPRHQITRY